MLMCEGKALGAEGQIDQMKLAQRKQGLSQRIQPQPGDGNSIEPPAPEAGVCVCVCVCVFQCEIM